MSALRILMIDNYDSFTYNLVQYFCERAGVRVKHCERVCGAIMAVRVRL